MIEFLSLLGHASVWVLGVIWNVLVVFFWVGLGLVVVTFVSVVLRTKSLDNHQQVDPVSAVREAMRRGELDADIARIEQRNHNRRHGGAANDA